MSIISTLICLYILTATYYLYQSSTPLESCQKGDADDYCLQPLLFAAGGNNDIGNDESSYLLLELYIPSLLMDKQETSTNNEDNKKNYRRGTRSKFEWTLVSTCSSSSSTSNEQPSHIKSTENQMIFPDFFINNNDDNTIRFTNPNKITKQCEIELPNFTRIRTNNPKTMNIFKGKFILKRVHTATGNDKQKHIILAETTFDLTRIIINTKKDEFAPFYKYYKQPLVLRIITDRQGYANHNPVRGDGFVMQRAMTDPSSRIGHLHHQTHTSQKYFYRPIFYVDDIALRQSSQIELAPPPLSTNDKPKPPVKLSIKITFISPLRDVIQRQLFVSIGMAEKILGPHELDEIKYLISDEYMYRFIITQIIGLIHLSLDYLAFKNEIGFYVGRGKDVTGISLSSMYSRFICDLVIFLYLMEGGQTSWFVLFSVGTSVGVELWKMVKFLQPKLNMQRFPFVSFRDLSQLSSSEQLTINYDSIARTYLSMILYPLVVGLALYQKQFYTYTSWYSWIISNLANAVYTFGFIGLCPQLYINYRLKSVAHLPWRVFMYKIFNTFVDDVFAFLIEMPLKHKIMTLRDDVVFVIFLFQAYIYRVDKTRANEFGYVYGSEETIIETLPENKGSNDCQVDEKHIKSD